MNKIANRSLILLALVLVLLVGVVMFLSSYLSSADDWVVASGSKHVYTAGRLQVGMLLDRTGALLVDNSGDRVYGTDALLRESMLHWTGDREGNINSPVLDYYARQLVDFDAVNGIYAYGRIDSRMRLTLSAQVQSAALLALGEYSGTIGIMNYETGELICAVSTPSFDPLDVPDIGADAAGGYEGVYVNRFIQSSYTPGSIFKVVTLAAALEEEPELQEEFFECDGNYSIYGGAVTCESAHGVQDLKTAFANSCNCAFARIALELGKGAMTRYAEQFGITSWLSFDGIVTARGNYDVETATEEELAWSAVGQQKDLVNPCTYLTFISAIAGGGQGVMPYVVSSVSTEERENYTAEPQLMDRILSEETALILKEYLGNNVQSNYGSRSFGEFTVCAKTGTAQVGGDKKPNAMLVGFVTDENYPYAFIVAVEDGGYGKEVCIPIIAQVLQVCKEAALG